MTNELKNGDQVGNPTNMKIPDFITKELFEKALKNGFNNKQIMITDLQVMMGSSSGDNYCSEIYRANIIYTMSGIANKTISLIVKAMPFLEARGPVLEDLEVYAKEVKMYTDTLPKLSALLNNEYLCAKCFYATEDPVQIIIFEDLKSLGYKMADRHSGLDENHCKLVLSKLARFHAASMILAEQDKQAVEYFTHGIFKLNCSQSVVHESLFAVGLSNLIDVVQTWNDDYKDILKNLQNLRENFLLKIEKHCFSTISKYKVLNHGDLWVNNLMFKYEKDVDISNYIIGDGDDNNNNNKVHPIDVVFIDYQMSYYSSPGMDLNYFISTSPMYDIREEKCNELISHYYETFKNTLNNNNNNMVRTELTIDDLRNEIKSREFYGFVASIGILPLVLLDGAASANSNFETLSETDAASQLRNALYFGETYQHSMKTLLKRFNANNVLNNILI